MNFSITDLLMPIDVKKYIFGMAISDCTFVFNLILLFVSSLLVWLLVVCWGAKGVLYVFIALCYFEGCCLICFKFVYTLK